MRLGTTTRLAAGLLTVGLIAAGCGDAPAGEQRATDEYPSSIALDPNHDPTAEFRWGYTTFASTWDPTESVNGADLNFWIPVYDRLLLVTPDGSIEPMLATSYTAADDLSSMTLELREGLNFSDGEPFNAEAVKYNLERNIAPGSRIAPELAQITSVEVIDEYTVKINVDGGLGSLAMSLTARGGAMVSPAAAEAGVLQSEPVGVGPYVTTSIVPGDTAKYTKTENYWDPEAQKVATLTYRLISDDQARYNAVVSGDLDGAQINPDQLDSADSAGLQVVARPAVNFLYISLNTSIEPFDDVDVRKALNMAVDRESIAAGLYDGHCTPNAQPVPPGSVGYSDKIGDGLDVYPYDPEAAKAILDEKGLTDLSFTIGTPNVTIYTKFAEIVQSQFADIGIDADVQPSPPAQMVEEYTGTHVVELIASVYTGLPDPDNVISRYVAPSSLFNPGNEDYPEMLEYAAEGASYVEEADRKAAYEKMMDVWMDQPPHLIPVCHIHLATGFGPNVSNVFQPTASAPDLRGVAVTTD